MTNIFPKRHKESIVLSDSSPPSLAFLILFTQKVSPGTTATSFNTRTLRSIQPMQTVTKPYTSDGFVQEMPLAGLGCCSSVNVITLNHRGVLSSFIQSTPAEHLLWVGQYARRYIAEGKERRKLLVLFELTSTFSWGIF